MKTRFSLARCFVVVAGLWAASIHLHAAGSLTFTDTWKDAGAYDSPDQMYFVKTIGSFSAKISLPLGGVDVSEADGNTQFSLAINGTQIVSDSLKDAQTFSPSKKSATFLLTDQNTMATIGSVTVSWTATTLTVTGSASEDILGMEQTFASTSTGVSSSTSLSSAVTGMYYEVSVGLDASDNGGGTFLYDNLNVPVTGNDKETEYNPPDMSGPYPLESGSIIGTGDFTPPMITVTSPAQNLKIGGSVISLLSGKASDNVGLAGVWCAVNGDFINALQVYDPATNLLSTSWSMANVDLTQLVNPGMPGTNTLQFYAIDTSSNMSSVVERTVFWAESATMTLQTTGAGSISGLKYNQTVNLGQGYAVKAVPAKGYILESWTDSSEDYLSGNASFNYLAGEADGNPSLTANFVLNPYVPLKGTYTGLFFDPANGPTPTNAGYLTLTLTTNGAYTGKLYLGTANYPISGQFNFQSDYLSAQDTASNWTEVEMKVSTHLELDVQLQLNVDGNLADPGAGSIMGIITAFDPNPPGPPIIPPGSPGFMQDWQVPVTLELSRYVTGTNVVAGVYNFAIPPVGGDPSQGPGGYGYGTATLTAAGAVTLSYNLADGVSPTTTFSSSVAADGTFPFFNILYGGKGIILGWLQFTNDPVNMAELEGNNLAWVKMPVADKFYAQGFSTMTNSFANLVTGLNMVTGFRYVAPKPGTNVFGWTIGELTLGASDPNATSDLADIGLTFNPAKSTFAATGIPAKELSLTFVPTTGLATGSYLPSPKASYSFHCLENAGTAWGFYADTNFQTGPVTIHFFPPIPPQTGDDSTSTGVIVTQETGTSVGGMQFPSTGAQ